MRLKTLFFLLALLLIVVWGILLMLALESGKTLFYVGEGVTTLSLIVLVYFYRKLVMPLNSIANGIDLLREQDFSSRLSKVGQAEADRIVTMFNGMMDQLKNERLRLREQNHFLDLLISVSPDGRYHSRLRRQGVDAECRRTPFLGLYVADRFDWQKLQCA